MMKQTKITGVRYRFVSDNKAVLDVRVRRGAQTWMSVDQALEDDILPPEFWRYDHPYSSKEIKNARCALLKALGLEVPADLLSSMEKEKEEERANRLLRKQERLAERQKELEIQYKITEIEDRIQELWDKCDGNMAGNPTAIAIRSDLQHKLALLKAEMNCGCRKRRKNGKKERKIMLDYRPGQFGGVFYPRPVNKQARHAVWTKREE